MVARYDVGVTTRSMAARGIYISPTKVKIEQSASKGPISSQRRYWRATLIVATLIALFYLLRMQISGDREELRRKLHSKIQEWAASVGMGSVIVAVIIVEIIAVVACIVPLSFAVEVTTGAFFGFVQGVFIISVAKCTAGTGNDFNLRTTFLKQRQSQCSSAVMSFKTILDHGQERIRSFKRLRRLQARFDFWLRN